MHSDAKPLNKHRHGMPTYQRSSLPAEMKKGSRDGLPFRVRGLIFTHSSRGGEVSPYVNVPAVYGVPTPVIAAGSNRFRALNI